MLLASSIGAALDITSQPDKGTRVRASLIRSPEATDQPSAAAGSHRRRFERYALLLVMSVSAIAINYFSRSGVAVA